MIPILSFLLTGSPSLPTHGLSQTNQISSRLWGSCQGLSVLIYSDLAAKLLMNVQQRPICSWSPQESSLFSMRLRPGPSCGSRAALPASCGGPAGTRCRARCRWHWGDLRWCWGVQEEGHDRARILGSGAPTTQFVKKWRASLLGPCLQLGTFRAGTGKPVSSFMSVSQVLC